MVVLVGMPNVGKSTIVRAVSSGTPEVNHYPFTTRGITVGHVAARDGSLCQVMDTPGLLLRDEGHRNLMEEMTLSAMRDLPSAILYVTDLTGTCGAKSPLREQLELRAQMKAHFATELGRPWRDVVSKCDLPRTEEALQLGEQGALACLNGAIFLSAPLGTGMAELNMSVVDLLEQAREVGHGADDTGDADGSML